MFLNGFNLIFSHNYALTKINRGPGLGTHSCNPSTQEVEEEGSEVRSQPLLHNKFETISPKQQSVMVRDLSIEEAEATE